MSNLDFISRSELLAEIDQERKRHIDSGNYGAEHLMAHSLRRLVEEAPAVDAVPVVHGRWALNGRIEHGINYVEMGSGRLRTIRRKYLRLICDMCMKVSMMDETISYAFCPHCGAKMDKEAVNAQE